MKIFIAGDSTASIKELDKRPETGWGEKLNLFLKDDIKIINAAQNGRSTKSFLNENRLEEINELFSKDDLLIIQFGHNDEKIENPERYASPKDYQNNLDIFIDKALNKGVFPIVFSSVSRRKFLDDNKTIDPKAIGEYPMLANKKAKVRNVLFIDMFLKTKTLYEKLGFELSKNLFLKLKPNEHINYIDGIDDNTHFNDNGALIIASLIAEELYYLNDTFKNIVIREKLLTYEEIVEILSK